MPGNPVQVVLSDHIRYIPPQPGGSEKDFFAGRDAEFAVHRQRLITQIRETDMRLVRSSLGGAGIIKVKMRHEALAKSHSPTGKIFRPEVCQQVGAGGLGEMYFEVNSESLQKISNALQDAESETRYKVNDDQKTKAQPSQLRSEVGAIEKIDLPHASDKRKFSAQQAVEWLSRPEVAGAYLVDLFYLPRTRDELSALSRTRRLLLSSFFASLRALPGGVNIAFGLNVSSGGAPVVLIKLTKGVNSIPAEEIPILNAASEDDRSEVDLNPVRHEQLLSQLDYHPVVRQVMLPPLFKRSHFSIRPDISGTVAILPQRSPSASYPKVAIIDSGVSSYANQWRLGTHDLLADEHMDEDHGTFIAGLLIGARACGNHPRVALEEDGCEFYDIAIMPKESPSALLKEYFPSGIEDFLRELRVAVEAAKAEHNIRVFNLSLNVTTPVNPDDYSPLATGIDSIARDNDIIFVISAGNLGNNNRSPWPADPVRALALLAARPSSDPLLSPAESVTSLTVGAINPPNVPSHVEGAPTCYTTRGPGLRVGIKPDLAHYGGGGMSGGAPHHHGLVSISAEGALVSDLGTSFAVPLVSKTLAALDAQITGPLPREALIALMMHNASLPPVLADSSLSEVARQFVGMGIPAASHRMLETGDNSITLVFSGSVRQNSELRFEFAWPQSLYDPTAQKCIGDVSVTLVYSPPLKREFGAEFIRVNVDAHLRQKQADSSWKGKLQPAYLRPGHYSHPAERHLIEHGLKWWPIKTYKQTWKKFCGGSSEWMLVVDALARSGQVIPPQGVPFSVIMTVSDSGGSKPVFNEFRQWLAAHNVSCADVKTAMTVRQRG